MNLVGIEDLYQWTSILPPNVSPNGSYAVIGTSQAKSDGTGYDHIFYLWNRLTGCLQSMNLPPILGWYDGSSYLFAESSENGSRLFLYSVAAGRSDILGTIPVTPVAAHYFAKDVWIFEAIVSAAETEQPASDRYCVITDLPYRIDNVGYITPKRHVLYLWYDGSLRKITEDTFDVAFFRPLPDCTGILACGKMSNSDGAILQMIQLIYTDTGEIKTIFSDHDLAIIWMDTDGDSVFFTAIRSDSEDGCASLYRLSLLTGRTDVLGEIPDISQLTLRGGKLFACVDNGFSRAVAELCDGSLRYLTPKDFVVSSFAFGGDVCMVIGCKSGSLSEVYTLENNSLHPISAFHEAYLSSHRVQELRPLSATTHDGVRIDGYVLLPTDYAPGRKYPAVLEIHGGPQSIYTTAFDHEMQLLSAQSYFVFFCNPRGSSGRGRSYSQLPMRKYGTYDYEDLMTFTDAVLVAYPDIDSNCLGVCGGSYGGYMAGYIIGTTKRFAAAVVQRPIADLVGFIYRTDFCALGSLPEEKLSEQPKLWDRSPISRASRAVTPTLIMQSEEDYRCPITEGLSLYAALRSAGVETRLVLFRSEGHELSRSGMPLNRVTRLEELVGWLSKHLHGGRHA